MSGVAWIGLGAMGVPMARRLARAGHDLVVWNRTGDRTVALTAAGARVAATPADAVRQAELVITMLAGPAAVDAVTRRPDGLAAAARDGVTVVDMSTIGPDAVARLRSALPEGAVLLDAPVLGSRAEAEAGTLTLLVGGPADAVERWRPVLAVLGNPVYLGPSGSGAAAKLVANSVLLGTVGVLAEALSLADGLGLSGELAWRVLGLTPLAGQVQRRRPAVEAGSYPPRFALSLARKDADVVMSAAGAARRDLRLARAVRSWLADAESAGLGGVDYTALIGHILSSSAGSEGGDDT